MMSRCIKLAAALLLFHFGIAQPGPGKTSEKWDLRKCVEYALEHNISVRQADLQIRFAELDFHQSKLAHTPTYTHTHTHISTSFLGPEAMVPVHEMQSPCRDLRRAGTWNAVQVWVIKWF